MFDLLYSPFSMLSFVILPIALATKSVRAGGLCSCSCDFSRQTPFLHLNKQRTPKRLMHLITFQFNSLSGQISRLSLHQNSWRNWHKLRGGQGGSLSVPDTLNLESLELSCQNCPGLFVESGRVSPSERPIIA